jgi:hypothetical protein
MQNDQNLSQISLKPRTKLFGQKTNDFKAPNLELT